MRSLAILFIVAANVLGGLAYPWQKLALAGLPPATVSVLRQLVALACLLPFLAATGSLSWRYSRRETGRLLLVGVVAYAAPLLLGIWGVRLSSAGNGSILILLEPVSILVIARLFLKEEVHRRQIIGVGAGLVGALLIVLERTPAGDLLAGDHLLGNLLLVLHAVLWGLYSPLMRTLSMKHRAMEVTFASMVFTLVVLGPASLLESPDWHAGPDLVPSLLWTLCLGVGVSFGSTVLWVAALKHLPASRIAPFVFLQPLAGVAIGTLSMHEPLSNEALLGGAFIVGGVLFVIYPRAARDVDRPAPEIP